MLFAWANFPYWIFLGLGILLFLAVIITGGGDEELELESDSNLEVLGFLGLGEAPLILLLAIDFSIWGVTGWLINVLVASFTGSIPQGTGGFLVLIISLLFSVIIGKLLAQPLGKIFATFGEDSSSDRLIGCLGTVNSATLPRINQGQIGQVDVLDPARNLVTVSVCLSPWAMVVPKRGDLVLIIDRENHIYLAVAKDSEDEEKWLEMRR